MIEKMKNTTTAKPRVPYEALFLGASEGFVYCRMVLDDEKAPVDIICIQANKAFEQTIGSREIEGKRITDLIPGVGMSHPGLIETCGRVSLTGNPERLEAYFKPLSKWFSISLFSPERGYFMAIFQNVTGRRAIEKDLENANIAARNVLEDLQTEKEALAHANAKDEALLESLGEGLIAVDNGRKIMVVNRVAVEMLGWTAKELIGKRITDLSLEDDTGTPVPFDERPTNIALSTGKPTKVTHFFVRKDASRFPMAITATPIKLGGKTIGLIEIIRDVTREQEIDRAKSEFVSLASHQLRTPLTTVSWYAEMILKGDVGEVVPSQRRYLEEIYQGNRQMIELVNTLLDVSRIELGTFKAESKPTDIRALAESALAEQKLNIEAKGLTIVRRFGSDISTLSTDPKLLRMVFGNLLSNAVEYTPPGGKITVSLALGGARALRIQVADTGYGIPKGQQDQIFNKFFRADNVRSKDTKGTGLGLYIVKSVVEHSGGKIWFESEENKGTIFYITLPIHT